MDEFVDRFEIKGPGVVDDMDEGQKLMEKFDVEFGKLESTRLEMGKRVKHIDYSANMKASRRVNVYFHLFCVQTMARRSTMLLLFAANACLPI